jgi:putative methyltransferase (TIGR04325 family)
MSDTVRHWFADWLPPHLRRMLNWSRSGEAVWYTGSYATWDEARRDATGYEDPLILEKVRESIEKVVRGEAAAERDSVLFDRVPYSFPLLAGLLRAALPDNRLCVVDIGGSLGSTYFQCRGLLDRLDALRWNVVEQPSFVECGRRYFQSEDLRFFETLDDCLAAEQANVAVLSSVLPYVEKPYELLDDVLSRRIEYVIIDRTPLLEVGADRLTVQHVPAYIYGRQLSYPAWFLARENVVSRFAANYELLMEFDALAGRVDVDSTSARDTGFVFQYLLDNE